MQTHMAGHGRQWPAMADYGRPWPAGHGRPCIVVMNLNLFWRFGDSVSNLQGSETIYRKKLPESCPKIVPKLPQSCPKVAKKLPESCPKVTRKLHESCPKVARGLRKSPSQKKERGKAKIDPEWAPEMKQKHRKSLPNGRQQPKGAAHEARCPLGAAPKAPPCCLPFGKDFRCFCFISGAHSGSILAFPRSFFWEGLFLNPRCSHQKVFFKKPPKKVRRFSSEPPTPTDHYARETLRLSSVGTLF